MITSLAPSNAPEGDDGHPIVSDIRQWVVIESFFSGSARVWYQNKLEAVLTDAGDGPKMPKLWAALTKAESVITPIQLHRYQDLATGPAETLQDFGDRFYQTWKAIQTHKQEWGCMK